MEKTRTWCKVVRFSISAVVLFFFLAFGTQALGAEIDNAEYDCKSPSVSYERSLLGCTKLIEKYSHVYNQRNLGMIYYNRGIAKLELDHNISSVNYDFERSCELGEGLGCCARAAEYFWIDGDDKKSQELVKRAERLSADEDECESWFW